MKWSNLLLLLSLFLVLVSSLFVNGAVKDAHACSCILITEQDALEQSFASFVGTPIINSTGNYTLFAEFEHHIVQKDFFVIF